LVKETAVAAREGKETSAPPTSAAPPSPAVTGKSPEDKRREKLVTKVLRFAKTSYYKDSLEPFLVEKINKETAVARAAGLDLGSITEAKHSDYGPSAVFHLGYLADENFRDGHTWAAEVERHDYARRVETQLQAIALKNTKACSPFVPTLVPFFQLPLIGKGALRDRILETIQDLVVHSGPELFGIQETEWPAILEDQVAAAVKATAASGRSTVKIWVKTDKDQFTTNLAYPGTLAASFSLWVFARHDVPEEFWLFLKNRPEPLSESELDSVGGSQATPVGIPGARVISKDQALHQGIADNNAASTSRAAVAKRHATSSLGDSPRTQTPKRGAKN
jgi:hypothetical protein